MRNSALEYLAMDVNESINWRAENGTTIKEWYDSLLPSPIPEGLLDVKKTSELLETSPNQVRALCRNNQINGAHKKYGMWWIPSKSVYDLRKRECLLVERARLLETLIEVALYISPGEFSERYGHMFFETLRGRRLMTTVIDSAKIFYDLRMIKHINENWLTIRDVYDRIPDMGIGYDAFSNQISARISDGEIKGIKLSITGRESGWEGWKIFPSEAERIINEERQKRSLISTTQTVSNVARALDVPREVILSGINRGFVEAVLLPGPLGYRIDDEQLVHTEEGLMTPLQALESYVASGYPPYRFWTTFDKAVRAGRINQEGIRLEDMGTIHDLWYQKSRQRLLDKRLAFRERIASVDVLSIIDFPEGAEIDDISLTEERKLWILALQEDPFAFDLLTNLYSGIIHRIARAWYPSIDLEDKVSYGVYGLWSALNNARTLDGNIRAYAVKYIKYHIWERSKEDLSSPIVSLDQTPRDGMPLYERIKPKLKF